MLFKKSNATVFSLWKRAIQKQSDQHSREWTLQLIESLLEATSNLTPGPLQRELSTTLTSMSIQTGNKGDTLLPIDFMGSIKAVFVNQGVPKLHKCGKWLLVNLKGRVTVWMKHYPIPEISWHIPADQYDGTMMQKGYDPWQCYRHANNVLNAAQPFN